MNRHFGWVVAVLSLLSFNLAAQTSNNSSASVSVPPVIQFSNVATDEAGAPLSGTVPVTFSLYNNSQAGSALWTETQSVALDSSGHYSVYLGLTQANGIPINLFTSGQAHWLGVKIANQPEQQPRIYLVSVPYAMKAGDAATVGGLPPSAFALAASANVNPASATGIASNASPSPATPSDVTTSGGTVDFVPLWDSTTDITSSAISQSGSASTAKIGINNTTPATALDVKGAATIRGSLSTLGTLSLPPTGAAAASKGANSQPQTLAASAFNSSTGKAVNQTFRWQAEPAGNDTATPSGTLNLLFGSGTTTPAETGLNIASNGQITFANGQTFSGVANLNDGGALSGTFSGNPSLTGNVAFSGTASLTNAGTFAPNSGGNYDYLTSSINGLNFGTEFGIIQGANGGASSNRATEAIAAGVSVPASPPSPTVTNVNAVAGYISDACPSGGGGCNSVAGYFQAHPTANGTAIWGINPDIQDGANGTAYNGTGMTGIENDISVYGSPNMTRGYLQVSLLTGTMPPAPLCCPFGNYTHTHAAAMEFDVLSTSTTAWPTGIVFSRGAVNGPALQVDTLNLTGASPSQTIAMVSYDGTNAHVGQLQTRNGVVSISNSTSTPSTSATFHQAFSGEAGSCSMTSSTTCTFSTSAAFTNPPIATCAIDAASAVPSTANSCKCGISGTTATITAGISNSLTWDCIAMANPN